MSKWRIRMSTWLDAMLFYSDGAGNFKRMNYFGQYAGVILSYTKYYRSR